MVYFNQPNIRKRRVSIPMVHLLYSTEHHPALFNKLFIDSLSKGLIIERKFYLITFFLSALSFFWHTYRTLRTLLGCKYYEVHLFVSQQTCLQCWLQEAHSLLSITMEATFLGFNNTSHCLFTMSMYFFFFWHSKLIILKRQRVKSESTVFELMKTMKMLQIAHLIA